MTTQDWVAVKAIYEEGILTGDATFETQSPAWEQWNEAHLPHSRLVALQQGQVCGWAALSAVSRRNVYKGVAEVSIYIAETARGKGIGKLLLQQLVEESEQHGIWTLQASIFAENKVSISLHQQFGFRVVGYREHIAKLHGNWRNTVILERRSTITGIN
jgi:phosphinothricin acetyltransferase